MCSFYVPRRSVLEWRAQLKLLRSCVADWSLAAARHRAVRAAASKRADADASRRKSLAACASLSVTCCTKLNAIYHFVVT